ncbi:polysaccharide lyase family 7 protein [Allomuricauda sp. R78024]|uniref:polysaccharide lyase family 7 protein n=1 Tax=Allomuricauda sp. R78024 TaxID=3093867 RepID=UPI0037CAA473
MFKNLPSLICLLLILGSCQDNNSVAEEKEEVSIDEPTTDVVDIPDPDPEETSFILPEIDLSNWKVTLPIGRPDEVEPPEILEYATNEKLKSFMYNDSIEGALVFYTYPGATTANSSRSRTELREQMEPGSNSVNWTFSQGGRLKGTLAMDDISKDSDDKYHRTIIMQIHGRLTNEQRDLIGQKDNNAPPMLKIYWQNGEVRVKTKVLKDPNVSNTDILRTDSWTDDEGFNFNEEVGFNTFSLEVLVSDGRMEVILNDTESVVYESDDIKKWGVFENYFKAGNYLQTSDEGSYARVKYYDLEVEH